MSNTNQDPTKKILSLFELNQHLARVVALNFPQSVWMRAEIAQISESKGNVYMSLVQKRADGEIVATAQANLWTTEWKEIKSKLGEGALEVLKAGVEPVLLVNLDFHERYGMRYTIQDIDAAWTLGQLEQQRIATLHRLREEQLLEKNKKLKTVLLSRNIAVITSTNAAGWKDFEQQLLKNPFGYQFKITVYESVVQGPNAPSELSKQLESINQGTEAYDWIVMVRGGGAKLDLACFDDYLVCKSIAESKIPVLTGIGHETDESLADLTAHTRVKTPTAAAEFLLQNVQNFEAWVVDLGQKIEKLCVAKIHKEQLLINNIENQISILSRHRLLRAKDELFYLSKQLDILAPRNVLNRGFSIIADEHGSIIKNVEHGRNAMRLTIFTSNGKFEVTPSK